MKATWEKTDEEEASEEEKSFPLRLPPGSLRLSGNQIGTIQGLEG
jgi:hypothetical protein